MTARVAFITGGGSGIGLATARELSARGWAIALADLSEVALAAAHAELAQRGAVLALPVDITDAEAVKRAVEEAGRELGPIAGAVNSAGIAADIPALETPVDVFRRVLDINVTGTFVVAQAVARHMRANGAGGAIVNLASVSGLRGSKGRSAYGASKGAVCTLTQVLANDLAQFGIRVNAVAPGPIDTPLVQAMHTDADRALWNRYIPMHRYGRPEEIARAIAFLLDEAQAGFITGEILAVDGGFAGAGVIAERDGN